MKAIIESTARLVKVIAEIITTEDNIEFQVEGDIRDTVSQYGLKYRPDETMIIEEIGEDYPADYASDKYLYIDGEFSLNPGYTVPEF